MAVDRRDFLKTAAGTLSLLLSRQGLASAQTPAHVEIPAGPAVGFGVIGLGVWGREILAALGGQALRKSRTSRSLRPGPQTSSRRRTKCGDWDRVAACDRIRKG